MNDLKMAREYGFDLYTTLEFNSIGSIDPLLNTVPNRHNVLYMIMVDDMCVYIGKSNNIKKRLSYYRNSINRTDKHSDKTKSTLIHDAISAGLSVKVYVRRCFEMQISIDKDNPVFLNTMDLEEPMMIKLFNPSWNYIHNRKNNEKEKR